MQLMIQQFNVVLTLLDEPSSELDFRHCVETFELKARTELLELEKKQIVGAFTNGQLDIANEVAKQLATPLPEDIKNDNEDAEQYFTETYESKA